MTNRSRFLPRLAIAALAIVVLVLGCRTDQRPFHYSGDPGEEIVGPSNLVVRIGEDCHADKEKLVLDTEATRESGSHDQVVWYVESGRSGDRVVIWAKPAEEQDKADPDKGRKIRDLFQTKYEIASLDETPSNNAIPSGRPKKTLLLLKQKAVVWKYNIDYYRGGQKLCSYDPSFCIQKPGSDGCIIEGY